MCLSLPEDQRKPPYSVQRWGPFNNQSCGKCSEVIWVPKIRCKADRKMLELSEIHYVQELLCKLTRTCSVFWRIVNVNSAVPWPHIGQEICGIYLLCSNTKFLSNVMIFINTVIKTLLWICSPCDSNSNDWIWFSSRFAQQSVQIKRFFWKGIKVCLCFG